ncbi:MAG: hypothetical protein JSS66_04750 [Armatimonadetes bacterium]|nr:hypothetical protein [Armatimonadota bacterium]
MAKILYDYDIGSKLDGNAAEEPEDIAMDIWMAYGGTELGDDTVSKQGKRTKKALKSSPQEQDKERLSTENSRWERLPLGQTIEDIASLEELATMLNGVSYGSVKAKAAPPAPPGGGMPPPMAEASSLLTRYAALLDMRGDFEIADAVDALALLLVSK